MGEHYKTLSAICPIIFREKSNQKQVLLLQRSYTGYMDGMWDFAGSGHVDENETAMQAVVRECKEEVGITVNLEDICFAHLSHQVGLNGILTYYDIYFIVKQFQNEPYIAEPQKCSGLEWFDIDNLPCDMIKKRKRALMSYFESDFYTEDISSL